MSTTDHLMSLFNPPNLLTAVFCEIPKALTEEQRRTAACWVASAATGALLGLQEKPAKGSTQHILARLLGYRQIVGVVGTCHLWSETRSTGMVGSCPGMLRWTGLVSASIAPGQYWRWGGKREVGSGEQISIIYNREFSA